jgi:pyridinium-3,5-bisthiocarboxylic acid mononucleotide nickel chelatase
MHAYFDAFSGIAGDMTVGALLDLGVPFAELERVVAGLELEGCVLVREAREHGPIRATRFAVRTTAPQPERTFTTIRGMLERGALAAPVRDRALAAFRALAEVEGKVHGVPPDHVHFHEVGGVDAIADIVGAAFGVEALGVTTIHVSPLPLGSGTVQSRHGPLPVPAPATVELLQGFAVRAGDGEGELVTPTGAAILRGFGALSGTPPVLRNERVGYGAGTRILADRPNVLRIILGEPAAAVAGIGGDAILALECNIDDMNPELYEHAVARLLAAGAVDVTLLPAQMKKGRPGTLLQVLVPPRLRDEIAAILFAETTTLGVRFHEVGRVTLARHVTDVATAYGPIAVKIAERPDGRRTIAPEYESCRAAATRHRVPLRVVYDAARRAAE